MSEETGKPMDETPLTDEALANEEDHLDAAKEDTQEAGDAQGQQEPHPADVILALQDENAQMKDKLLRTLADMENLRRRTERDIADSRKYAVANFARDILGVSDNLDRALQAISPEAREGADETLKNLLEGVSLTERELQNVLSKNGVQQLAPEGDKFDPNFHQAMFEVPNEVMPNGTVVQVVQAGYKIGDRVLRPAMVGVSKGGPKVSPIAKDSQAENTESVDRSV